MIAIELRRDRIEIDPGLVVVILVGLIVLYVVVVAARKQQLLGRPGGIQLALRVDTTTGARRRPVCR